MHFPARWACSEADLRIQLVSLKFVVAVPCFNCFCNLYSNITFSVCTYEINYPKKSLLGPSLPIPSLQGISCKTLYGDI
ncbi:unnamed protein product, partial [Vitis vinifera]